MGRISAIYRNYADLFRGFSLFVICFVSACAGNQQTADNNLEKPIFADETLSYIPFANSYSDQPPSSIGLVNADDHNQSVKIADNSSVAGNVDFLYQTEFNYFDDEDKSPSLRDKDYNATVIYAGSYDGVSKKVTNYHADRFLFAKGGRLYQQKIWKTQLTDAKIISTETQFFKNQLCSISTKGRKHKKLLYVGHDYEDINKSVIIYKIGKVFVNAENKRLKSCAPKDVSWKFIQLGMGESTAPKSIQAQLTGSILRPIHNVSSGALEGWIASDADGVIHHFNSDFSSSQIIPIPTHNGDSNSNNDWIVFLDIDSSGTNAWFATHGQHIYQYNIISKQLVAPAGAVDFAIDALPDNNHILQVYGAYKNDRYPIFRFDKENLYFLIHNKTPSASPNGNDQFQYSLMRIPLVGAASTPETIASFQAHDIGKMVLTDNKIVLSVTYASETREGVEFLMFDKQAPFGISDKVVLSSGHQCMFNIFTYKNLVFGNSVGLASCQQPTTNSTHIHFFQFTEDGQSSFVDSHHSRLLGTVRKGNYDPFIEKDEVQYLIVKRNTTSTENTWIDSINVYDPIIKVDIRTLGQIDIKQSAISARMSLLAGFNNGLIEYQSKQGHQKLYIFSVNSENSLIPFSPQFEAQVSNRWIAPFAFSD